MGDREFPIVNVTYESCSDVASYILETTDVDMVGYFFERGDGGWQYGFRSRNGVTVHDHAKQFGGGGHPRAAGCVTEAISHKRLAGESARLASLRKAFR
jgi:phosphoesterase RecJ-like protein